MNINEIQSLVCIEHIRLAILADVCSTYDLDLTEEDDLEKVLDISEKLADFVLVDAKNNKGLTPIISIGKTNKQSPNHLGIEE